MDSVLKFLSGKKTYLLVVLYVVLQLASGGGLDDLNVENIQDLVLAAMVATLRAGVAKITS